MALLKSKKNKKDKKGSKTSKSKESYPDTAMDKMKEKKIRRRQAL